MPDWKQEIIERLTGLKLEPVREAEIVEELAQHLDDRYRELLSGGASKDEAASAARAELNNSQLLAQELSRIERPVTRETVILGARRANLMSDLWQDLRYGLRMLGKNPGLTAVIVLTLALGIGVNTSIFSLINAVLLKPLPVVKNSEQLVWFRASSSYPNYEDYRDQNDVFSGITAISGTRSFSLNSDDQPEMLKGEFVTANYFSVLGVDPVMGRAFLPEEDAPGSHPIVVISHNLWQRKFGADANLAGRTITINGMSFTVIGIAPRGFIGAEVGLPRDLWIPMTRYTQLNPPASDRRDESESDRLHNRNTHWLNLIARLKPGVSREQAEAAMTAIASRMAEGNNDSYRDERIRAVTLLSVSGGLDPRDRLDAAPIGGLLMAIVGLVLLIACANVAGLLLARASSRQKEVGIRQAMGASRFRIVRQLLTESLILSLLAGVVALLLAWWTTNLLIRLTSSTPIADIDLSLDYRVLIFTLAISLLTSLVFGLAPALQASRIDLVPVLKNETIALRTSFHRSRLRNGFVIAQLALSLILLIGSGLFIRSLQNAKNIDPGFVVENGLMVPINPGMLRYSEEKGQEFYRQLIERVEAMPGVERASLMNFLPLGLSFGQGSVFAEGQESSSDDNSVDAGFNIVGVDYFQTMGITLVRGREFGWQDRKGAPGVVVINESLARQLFPDQDPIGKRVRSGGSKEPLLEIIGVARDSKYATLGERERAYIYQPLLQNYRGAMTLVVRTTNDPRSSIDAVRGRVQALDPNLPVSDIKTLAEQIDFSLFSARIGASLLGAFGLLALALAAIGIYGLVAYSVRHRTHEIGVRMALGARQSDVLKLLLKEGMVVVTIGIIIGLGLAFAATQLVASFLYGVSATDTITFLIIPSLLAGVALVASLIPARRATKVDPMEALRYE